MSTVVNLRDFRRGRAMHNRVVAEDAQRMEAFGEIERLILSVGMTPVQFAELVLDVTADKGEEPQRWQRIKKSKAPKRRERV